MAAMDGRGIAGKVWSMVRKDTGNITNVGLMG